MNEVIAKLDLIFQKPSGERFPVSVEIGKPYEIKDEKGWNHARCPVATKGLYGEHPDMAGENTFKALLLSLGLVQRLMTDFLKKGGKIYYADEESELDFKPYFDIFRI